LGVTNVVTLNFSIPQSGPYGPFTFMVDDSTNTAASVTWSFSPSSVVVSGFNVLLAQVPEPASLGLLVIGMTGFFTFRRLLRRARVS
jgi:hypothetical protein